MQTLRKSLLGLIVLFLLVTTAPAAKSCPFCSAPSLTLSEQVAQSDAVVLVQWVGGKMTEGQKAGSTTYEIVKVVKQPKPSVTEQTLADVDKEIVNVAGGNAAGTSKTVPVDKAPSANQKKTAAKVVALVKDDRVTLTRFRAGKTGDLFLLMGTKGTVIEWGSPLEVSETSFNYISQAPSPETDAEKRLRYFVKFLEFPDLLISNDAYGEFANAPYKHIAPLAKDLPREKLRTWISDPKTPPTRLGLYGLLLGLCGTEEDAALMEQKINEQTEDFRLGIDGVISGYLLLTKEKGLDVIDETKLRDSKVPFSETYAAMQALRFMWSYAEGTIGKDRLRQSMRILLDRPELADLVIADLARWQDWSIQDRLMSLYGAEEYNIPSIKRAIVRFMLVSTKYKKKEAQEQIPAYVVKGKKHLARLRERDPKTVKDAERFFFLN